MAEVVVDFERVTEGNRKAVVIGQSVPLVRAAPPVAARERLRRRRRRDHDQRRSRHLRRRHRIPDHGREDRGREQRRGCLGVAEAPQDGPGTTRKGHHLLTIEGVGVEEQRARMTTTLPRLTSAPTARAPDGRSV